MAKAKAVKVLDYSASYPAPAAIRAAGYVGVLRYIGTPTRPKNVQPLEAAAMHAADISMGFVFEGGAGWMLDGSAAGAAAARACLEDAIRCGVVIGCLFLAADFDVTSPTQMSNVRQCLAGARHILAPFGVRVGIYGEADVIDACVGNEADLGWQTRAWSGGRVSDKACLLQEIGYKDVGGVQCDSNTVLKEDWGQSGGDEMASAEYQDLSSRLTALKEQLSATYTLLSTGDGGHPYNLRSVRGDVAVQGKTIQAQQAAINALIRAVGEGFRPEQLAQLQKTVTDAVENAVVDVEINVHGGGGDAPTPTG